MNYTLQNRKDPPRWFVIIWLIVLFFFIAWKIANGQERNKLPALNQKILHYVDSVLGTQVGGGICWEFVHGALNYAGAKTEVYKDIGNLFTKKRYIYFGEQIREREARPGDIIDFCYGHPVIIYDKISEFEYLIAHQNISVENVVEITPLCTDCVNDRWGSCHLFYRPVSK